MPPSPSPKPTKGQYEAPMDDAAVNAEIMRLACLSDLAYVRERKSAAEKLDLPINWLDKMVKAKKGEIIAQAVGDQRTNTAGQGRPIELREPEPWAHPVDGAELLSSITAAVEKHMVMEPGAAACAA